MLFEETNSSQYLYLYQQQHQEVNVISCKIVTEIVGRLRRVGTSLALLDSPFKIDSVGGLVCARAL